MVLATCRSTITYVNESGDEAGKSYIFVNGVNNTIDDAETSASNLSGWLGNKRVVLFHNPTTLSNGQAMPPVQNTQTLIRGLLNLIQNEFRRCQDTIVPEGSPIKMYVFTHSHGSVLIKNAMQSLGTTIIRRLGNQEPKNLIEIISFGGGVLIPKDTAYKVRNFVNEFDLVPVLANNPIPSNSDIGRITQNFGIQNAFSNIFSEVLLYQQNNNDNLVAGQVIKSKLIAHHKTNDSPSDLELLEGILHELITHMPQILNTLAEASILPPGVTPPKDYSVYISRRSSTQTFGRDVISSLVTIINDPYNRVDKLISALIILSNANIGLLNAHKLESYLGNITPQEALNTN